MTLDQFVAKYTGVKTGNTDANLGQCVGLVSVWMDTFQIPHEFGNAKDLLNNANTQYVDVIHNTPTGVPLAGDILVWDIGTYGHTAIFVSGDANTFKSFDQNYPDGSLPHIQDHNYDGVIGWLHIKVQSPSDALTACLTQHTQLVIEANQKDATINNLNSQISKIQSESSSKDTQISTLTSQLTGVQTQIEGLTEQAKQLTEEATTLKDELNQAKQDRTTYMNELQIMNKKMANMQGELNAKKPKGFIARLVYIFS